jgi:DNA polymerase III subunit delta
MSIYLFWGDDDFALTQAVTSLRNQTLDPDWASFNYDRIDATQCDGAIQGFNQAMTPPFGLGKRFIWLVDPPCLQSCSDSLLTEITRTLPVIPETSVVVITSSGKPNGRLKLTKLLQQAAMVQEFAPIPPWKTDDLENQLRQAAKTVGVKLTRAAGDYLVEAIGNNSRLLYNELEKLRVFAHDRPEPLDLDSVSRLVLASSQSSLQLASAILQGDSPRALGLVSELLDRNEPALKITATLIGQFRTWTKVKVLTEAGVRDEKDIATAAEIGNPKRVYILQKEIRQISARQLLGSLPLLLALDYALKQGQDDRATLQTQVIALCDRCRS